MDISAITLDKLDAKDKTVLVRLDLNVPLKDGVVQSDTRISESLPTVRHLLDSGARVIICSHLGRPKGVDDKYSLAPVAERLGQLLGLDVPLFDLDNTDGIKNAPVSMLQNVRFYDGETQNDETLARRYADLADAYVMDAFGSSHRAHASTEAVARVMRKRGKGVALGFLMAKELDAIGRALTTPKRPVVAVVGGAKVSSKLDALFNLADICDSIIVGGGIANTFLALDGGVGASLYEPDLLDSAKKIRQKTQIITPLDVIVAKKSAIDGDNFIQSLENAQAIPRALDEIQSDEMILDVGQQSMDNIAKIIKDAGTLIFNGPLGVFEATNFSTGTRALCRTISDSNAYTLAGGGDTLLAIETFDARADYLSTGGGAFLHLMEGKDLPAVMAMIN